MLLRKFWIVLLIATFALTVGCRKKTADDLLKEASESFTQGDLMGVMLKCQRIVDMDPNSARSMDARALLARCREESRDFEGARQTLGEIVEKKGLGDVAGQWATNEIVSSFQREGKIADAIKVLEKTQERKDFATNPAFARDMKVRIALLYRDNKEPKKAEAYMRDLIAKTKDENEFMSMTESLVGLFMRDERTTEAMALYDDYLKKYPESTKRGLIIFGKGFLEKQMAEKAKDEATKAALTMQSDKTLLESETILKKQYDAEPLDDAKTRLAVQVSRVYRVMNRNDDAVALLEGDLAKRPENPGRGGIVSELVEVYLSVRNYAAAQALLQKLTTTEKDPKIVQWASQALVQVQREKQAETAQTSDTLTTTDTLNTTGTLTAVDAFTTQGAEAPTEPAQ
jgi:tetratricopeptide (TPR) repeat protein